MLASVVIQLDKMARMTMERNVVGESAPAGKVAFQYVKLLLYDPHWTSRLGGLMHQSYFQAIDSAHP